MIGQKLKNRHVKCQLLFTIRERAGLVMENDIMFDRIRVSISNYAQLTTT